MNFRTWAPGAVIALALCGSMVGCSKSPADMEFDAKVRAYLLEHPEVIREAINKLQEKDRAEALQASLKAIKENRDKIERDPRDFVANPNGKVTVTEFYDYNCGHCKNVTPAMMALISSNPDVRFVFKEYHIFDVPSSLRGARAALLSRPSGRYLQIHKELMAVDGLQPEGVDAVLRANGVDPSPLDNPQAMAEIDRHLADIQQLAATLRIDGTPSFVIGDTLVVGEDLDGIKAAIAQARARAG